jgi:predicted extracellular nuclease
MPSIHLGSVTVPLSAAGLLLLASMLGGVTPAWAAGSVPLSATAYTENFDTLANSGTASTTPEGWYFAESGTNANTTYTAGTGSANAGDTYSFGAAGSVERAFGGLQSASLTPMVGAQLTNATGGMITGLSITYTGEQWRLGATGRSDRLDFQYSLDATSLTTGTWIDVDALDFTGPATAGTAGALDGNAAANRTVVAANIAALGIAPGATVWLRWNSADAPGADDGLALDELSITASVQPTENQPIAASAAPPAISTTFGIAGSSVLTASDPDSIVTGAIITSGAVAGITLDGFTPALADGGAATATLNVAGNVPAGSYSVVVTLSNNEGQSTNLSVPVAVAAPLARIHDVQGSGPAVVAGTYTVEAIVTGEYQTQGSGQLRGFFVQEEDVDADTDPATPEGIFVFCSACPVNVKVGDLVRVTGAASEFFAMSQLTATSVASVTVLSSGNALPTPATIALPVPGVLGGDLAAATAAINAYFEAFEGMLVTFPAELSVSEYFELARYGQVILSAGGRPRQFTDAKPPSAAGLIDHEIDLARRTIILDDTDNRQNRPIDVPNTAYFHPVPGLSTSNYFRGGDTITGLTGVLHWSFAGQTGTDAWRIRPVTEAHSYAFTRANPRPAAPGVGGRLRVASFNVLNYFLTVDTTASNDVGTCSPSLLLDCRGPDSAQELERQRAKLTQALLGLKADIVGLIEMENTPGVTPPQEIVDDLNAMAGAGTYAYLDTGVIGTDAIRVGMVYKPATVTPVGNYAILDSTVDPRFIDTRNRPALAQSFQETHSGARFTVAVTHFKSKGSGCGAGDDDTTTGQGNCNGTRTLAAQALADWLAGDPTGSGDPDVLIIGDLNSYAQEDPIAALRAASYTDLVAHFGGPDAYSYVFDGRLGYLDHALANASLSSQVTGVAEWHINADEIPLFDYNDEVRDAGEATFEEESDVLPLYEANAFRTSDHDPVVVGLELSSLYRARQVDKRVWIERNIDAAGLGDFDGNPVDGWALVGRTNGAADNGELRGFFVGENGSPYAVVFNYRHNKGNRCILVTPRSLDLVRKGQTRMMNTVADPYIDPQFGCQAP